MAQDPPRNYRYYTILPNTARKWKMENIPVWFLHIMLDRFLKRET